MISSPTRINAFIHKIMVIINLHIENRIILSLQSKKNILCQKHIKIINDILKIRKISFTFFFKKKKIKIITFYFS